MYALVLGLIDVVVFRLYKRCMACGVVCGFIFDGMGFCFHPNALMTIP